MVQSRRNGHSKSHLIIMRQPDLASWSSDLRTKREALSLIHFLRDQSQPQSELLNAISSDQTLSEPVCHLARPFAREWKP